MNAARRKPENGVRQVSKYVNIGHVVDQYFNGRVQQDIEGWPVGFYADFLRLIHLMEKHGADLRMPHSRVMVDRQIVILHSFIKKTQETPERELAVARKRLKEVRNAH